jgi:hypothetical protein
LTARFEREVVPLRERLSAQPCPPSPDSMTGTALGNPLRSTPLRQRLSGGRLHQPAVYFQGQRQFDEIAWPRE